MNPFNTLIALLVLLQGLAGTALAQTNLSFSPLQDDDTRYQQWLFDTEKRYQQDVSGLAGSNKKYLQELYKERYEKIKTMYADKDVVAAPAVVAYLQGLVAEITRSNTALQGLANRIVFSRNWWPNASSMGEGTIVFNIGLFHKLQNESQAAFVLCHELAHLYLDHSNRNIQQYVNTVYSAEFQKELKKIQKSEYQKRQQLEGMVKTLAFRNRRHSREHESEADSLALEWLKNTAFDVRGALSCLALLDSADEDKYNIAPQLEKQFHFSAYPFQKRWVEEEKSLFSSMAATSKAESKKEQDSLKTHPDCSTRIRLLESRVQQYHKDNSREFVISDTQFRQLQKDFDFEIIEHLYRSDNISRSLYFTLQMLESYPDNSYLIANTGRCLNKLYKAQKEHTLSKLVDLPSPYNDKKYDQLLQFIQRLRLPDIAALSYYYLQAHQGSFTDNEDFLEALINSKENFNKPGEKEQWIQHYRKKFPRGKYSL